MVIAFGVEMPDTPALIIDLDPPEDDPFIRQELVETSYHLLWELVHVFLEHDERTVHDTGAASFLYPFLGEQETDHEAVVADVRRSILMKAEEIGELRAQTLTEGRDALAGGGGDGARAAAVCSRSATAARPPTRRISSPTSSAAGRAAIDLSRRPSDPDRDRQRHRRRGDLLAPGDRLRAAGRRAASRSRPAAARRT